MKLNNPFDTSIKYQFTNKIKGIIPIKDHVIVSDMNFGERTLSTGIVLLSDDAKSTGIRPRWAKVYAVGPDQKDVNPNQWILVEHGRWTRGVKVEIDDIAFTVRRVDADAILAVSDEQPNSDDILSSALVVDQKTR
jgi:co-chaperonin GroES (HSP10)